ncbi:MAG: Tim44 domain-containing protein [Betaproteobacteria bacterium]|nr:Tim44 domain-containing protein [Betaproteobacteria bacterium]
MTRFLLTLFALFLTFALPANDAEAKRFGGGKSSGMQRSAPMKREAAPQQAAPSPANAQPGVPPQAAPKRSWMGPLAGLAAGLGLAALASHLGFGEEMANFLMIALLALAAFMLVRWLLNRSRTPAQAPMQYAGMGAQPAPVAFDQTPAGVGAAAAPVAAMTSYPPGFDVEAFVRQAKLNFLRLQAAYDAGNLDDLREFTAPEMYAEIKLQLDERKGAAQRTEVTTLNADVTDWAEEGERHVVSVRFHGEIVEEAGAQPAAFDEVWHLTRPASGKGGWTVAGIQQAAYRPA